MEAKLYAARIVAWWPSHCSNAPFLISKVLRRKKMQSRVSSMRWVLTVSHVMPWENIVCPVPILAQLSTSIAPLRNNGRPSSWIKALLWIWWKWGDCLVYMGMGLYFEVSVEFQEGSPALSDVTLGCPEALIMVWPCRGSWGREGQLGLTRLSSYRQPTGLRLN